MNVPLPMDFLISSKDVHALPQAVSAFDERMRELITSVSLLSKIQENVPITLSLQITS